MIVRINSFLATVGQEIPLGLIISMKMLKAIGKVFITTILSKVQHKSMASGMI
jgi:hypothetical protein